MKLGLPDERRHVYAGVEAHRALHVVLCHGSVTGDEPDEPQ